MHPSLPGDAACVSEHTGGGPDDGTARIVNVRDGASFVEKKRRRMRGDHSPRIQDGIDARDADAGIGIVRVNEQQSEECGGGVFELPVAEEEIDEGREDSDGNDEKERHRVT